MKPKISTYYPYRIKKYKKGYVVEVYKSKWYFYKYWTHFISVSGITEEPWYFSTYDHAERGLINEIKWNTAKNSRY